LGRNNVPDAISPLKQPCTLPVVLRPDEVVRFFAAIRNIKHRGIIMADGQWKIPRPDRFSRPKPRP
jgi:hypothetical protein